MVYKFFPLMRLLFRKLQDSLASNLNLNLVKQKQILREEAKTLQENLKLLGKYLSRVLKELATLSTTRLTGNQTTSDGITRPATMG